MLHVVVVGGGPAGLIAAEATAKAGIKTTLIERAPDRNVACAGLLSSSFMAEFQVPELLLAQRVHEIALVSPAQQMAFVGLSSTERWAGVMRRELLTTLFRRRAEEAGVSFIHGRFTRFRHADGDYPVLEVKRADGTLEQIHADVVIGADGAASRVARAIGLPPLELGVVYQERFALPEGAKAPDGMQLHLARKVSADTFGWLLPQGDQVVVGVATATRYGRRVWDMLGELKKRLGSLMDGAKSVGREAFCYPLTTRPRLTHDRVLLVGDAAGLAAPTVRDGLYFACKSALMAAEAVILHQNMPTPENLASFQKAWTGAYGEVLAGHQRLEEAYLGADRQREILVDLAWDREAQRMVVDAFLAKRPVVLPLGVSLRLATRKVSHRIKHRLMGPKRLETEQVARAMPRVENYLDLALKSPELTSTIPEANPAPPVEHQ